MAANRSYQIIIFLFALLVLGAFLRWFNLAGSTSFFYDQGRDALAALGILNKDFVLVGPPSDFPGIFMGALWYYLLALLYFLGRGNPVFAIVAISFIDLATIILIVLVGKRFFGTKSGLLAGFFWAVSAFSVSYARTLSNPSTSAFWALLTVFCFLKIKEGKKVFAVILGISLAVLWQFNPASAFLFTPAVLISLFFIRKEILKNKMLWFLGSLVFIFSFFPQLLFEIRNSFLALSSVSKIFLESGPKEGYLYGVSKRFLNLEMELAGYTFYRYYHFSVSILILSFLYVYKKLRKKKLFFSFFFVPALFLLFIYPRGQSHPHYLLSWVPLAVIVVSAAIWKLSKIHWFLGALVVGLFLYLSSFGLIQEIITKDHIAQPADPNLVSLNDQILVLDHLYKNSGNKMFGYHTYNITPYWADENWQYMFKWHGLKKYGYIPERRSGNPMYLIYEPDPFLPEMQKNWLKEFRKNAGKKIETFRISQYKIEKYEH